MFHFLIFFLIFALADFTDFFGADFFGADFLVFVASNCFFVVVTFFFATAFCFLISSTLPSNLLIFTLFVSIFFFAVAAFLLLDFFPNIKSKPNIPAITPAINFQYFLIIFFLCVYII